MTWTQSNIVEGTKEVITLEHEEQIVCDRCGPGWANVVAAYTSDHKYLGRLSQMEPKFKDMWCPTCGEDGWKGLLPNGKKYCVHCKEVEGSVHTKDVLLEDDVPF